MIKSGTIVEWLDLNRDGMKFVRKSGRVVIISNKKAGVKGDDGESYWLDLNELEEKGEKNELFDKLKVINCRSKEDVRKDL